MTLEERLANVQAAITKAEERQEYSIKDRSMKSAELETLYAREERLLALIDRRDSRATRGGIRSMEFTA